MQSNAKLIVSCEAPQKPVFSEIKIYGVGKGSSTVEKLTNEFAFRLLSEDHTVTILPYAAFVDFKGNDYYDGNKAASENHEVFHIKVKKNDLGLKHFKGKSLGHRVTFEEAAATAIEEYLLLSTDPENEAKQKSIELKLDFGRKVYDFVNQGLTKQNLTKEEIKEFAKKTFVRYEIKNWASILIDFTYFGFLEPCYKILEKQGLQKGEETLLSLIGELKEDPTAEKFFERILLESGTALDRIQPIMENVAMRGLVQYGEEEYFRIELSAQKGEKSAFLKQTLQDLLNKNKDLIESVGEKINLIWAEHIILG